MGLLIGKHPASFGKFSHVYPALTLCCAFPTRCRLTFGNQTSNTR